MEKLGAIIPARTDLVARLSKVLHRPCVDITFSQGKVSVQRVPLWVPFSGPISAGPIAGSHLQGPHI